MTFLATTTVKVLRGSEEDEYGDTVDSNTPVKGLHKVPIAITVKTKTVYLPDSGDARKVREYVGRVTPGIGIETGDRLVDNRTERVYIIDDIVLTSNYGFGEQCILDLRIVTE